MAFEVVDWYYDDFEVSFRTKHSRKRTAREKLAIRLCKNERAYIVDGFIIDKGHYGGREIHWVLSNGVIVILNYVTLRFITLLIGRPGQIRRYYDAIGEEAPNDIVDYAREHQISGYNSI